MMKKIMAIITVLTVMFTLVPAAIQVSAETDPEGTIIVYNDTTTLDDPRFTAYNAAGGGNAQKINAQGSGDYQESKLTGGPDGRNAVQLLKATYGAWYELTDKYDASLAGTYDIYFWNVCEGTDTRNGSATYPDYYAQYDVVAKNGGARYFVNQKTASGGKEGPS